jgi:mRNA-degrading endonuclease RelE of RelBE toxin-antitoxin system
MVISMNVEISRAFVKDTALLPKKVKLVILEVIKEIQIANVPGDIRDYSKLKGAEDLYRIRRGVYRIIFQYDNNTATLKRVLPRGQIYKKHNLK